jgi:ABC-type nitrate/sulfonate/bicarbonate transport system ATPase subunit
MGIILDWDLTIKCKQERTELGVTHERVESIFLAPNVCHFRDRPPSPLVVRGEIKGDSDIFWSEEG